MPDAVIVTVELAVTLTVNVKSLTFVPVILYCPAVIVLGMLNVYVLLDSVAVQMSPPPSLTNLRSSSADAGAGSSVALTAMALPAEPLLEKSRPNVLLFQV